MNSLPSFSLLLALTGLLWGSSAVGASPRVVALDEHGQPIREVPAINLAPGALGIPIKTFELLGLKVRYRPQDGRVYLSNVPDPRIPRAPGESLSKQIAFKAGDHQAYSPYKGYFDKRYSYPVALNRDGQLYVSVGVVREQFISLTCRWDQKTGTVTLQRRNSSVVVW